MAEVERIREQLQRAVHGDAWHGPAILELLGGVTAAQAAAHPIPGGHSIAELTHHITTWATVVRRRIEGLPAVEVTEEVNWGRAGALTRPRWKAMVAALETAHADLDRVVSGLDDKALARTAKGSPTSVYVLLHGAIQHGLYHAGQIAQLKRVLSG